MGDKCGFYTHAKLNKMVCQKALTPASLRREEPLAGNKPAGVGGGVGLRASSFVPLGSNSQNAMVMTIVHKRNGFPLRMTVTYMHNG